MYTEESDLFEEVRERKFAASSVDSAVESMERREAVWLRDESFAFGGTS